MQESKFYEVFSWLNVHLNGWIFEASLEATRWCFREKYFHIRICMYFACEILCMCIQCIYSCKHNRAIRHSLSNNDALEQRSEVLYSNSSTQLTAEGRRFASRVFVCFPSSLGFSLAQGQCCKTELGCM